MNIEEYINTPILIKNDLLNNLNLDDELILFDIGACECEDTIIYSKLFPKSKIFSFEPIPNNFLKGKCNLDKYQILNAELYQIALSNSNGTADFFVSKGHPDYIENNEDWDYGNKSSSLLPAKELSNYYKWLNLETKITVETLTINQFCKNKQIDKIDFIHMDVQGAELMVLEGMENMLSKTKLIWLEAELVELYKGQPLKDSVIKFLNNNNFLLIKDNCLNVSGDMLFLNNNMK